MQAKRFEAQTEVRIDGTGFLINGERTYVWF